MRFDVGQLEALAAVVREGGFDRAARVLHVTPSAVSQRIRALEERCGAVLVVRGSPCTATPAGRLLCRHAERLAALDHELAALLPGGADREDRRPPTLRVAVNADSLDTWFVAAAARFAQRSGALLDLVVEDQDHGAGALRRGEVIAAVTSRATPVQGCRSLPLGRLRYLACASPAFVERWFARGVTATALGRAPSLRFDRRDRLQARWARAVCGRAVEMPCHWLPSTASFLEAAIAGLGWGMIPQVLGRTAIAQGRLRELSQKRPLDTPLYWQHARLATPLLERLTDAVVAVARTSLE